MASAALPRLVVISCPASRGDDAAQLLARLPADFAAPVVVVPGEHAAPDALAAVIRARSALSVRAVRDRARLRAGTVYVAAGEQTAEVHDGEIWSTARRSQRGGPAEHLLAGAAKSYQDRLITVIFSGPSPGAAAAARLVKEAGGVLLLVTPDANEASAAMALIPTPVDVTGDVTQIVQVLQDLVAPSRQQGQPISPISSAARLVGDLFERVHAREDPSRGPLSLAFIRQTVGRYAALADVRDLDNYAAYVDQHPEEYERLVKSLLVKGTGFFRDRELFACLEQHVLPEVIAQASAHGDQLRIWVAGCGTGEEVYSTAILIGEALGDAYPRLSVRIFATDLDADAIQFARRGVYPAAALEAMSLDRAARFFTRIDGGYEVAQSIRSLIIFGQHDMAQRAAFPRTGMVLCHNVLDELPLELQTRGLNLFAFSLRDGGFLVLGNGTTVVPPAALFAPHEATHHVYRRHGEPVLVTPMQPGRAQSAAWPASRKGVARPTRQALQRGSEPQPTVRPDLVLEHLPTGVIVVDRRYHIRAVNIAARRMLGLHIAALNDDLIHSLMRYDVTELRAGIDAALRGEAAAFLWELRPALEAPGPRQYLQIVCSPAIVEGGQPTAVAISLDDRTDLAQERDELRIVAERERLAAAEALQFREGAEARWDQAARVNEQLTLMNLELQSVNEEFSVERQETLTALEEVETLNEELQATNEELEALSEEQKVTVAELNIANQHLERRARELQHLTESLDRQRQASEAERARLSAVLVSVGDPIVVVDRAANAILTNPAYDRTFGGGSGMFLALDESGRLLPADEHPLRRAARGESFVLEFTIIGPDGSRRRCEATCEPVNDGGVARGVVAIRDVTERSIYRVQDEFLALASHELRTPLSAVLIYLELLEQRSQNREGIEELHTFAARALHQAQRLKDLTGDLLDATRLQHGKLSLRMRTTDLGETVERAVEAAQANRETPIIRLDRAQEPVRIHGDPSRIEQVVLNLLNNALTYSEGTNEIRVRIERKEPWAEILVQDFGQGIAPAELPFVFDRFRQVQKDREVTGEGLGLGLYIAKEIVTAHGGTIAVESAPGQGTTFTIRLPLTPVQELSPT